MSNNFNSEEGDPFNLNRFIEAQQNLYTRALTELQNGDKQSHWMWFIFPQIDGLGTSETAIKYAIKSFEEAISYLKHPVLGARLVECCSTLLTIKNKSSIEILGTIDAAKLQSSMTLFSLASPDNLIFVQVLEKYYKGIKDKRSIDIIHTLQDK